MSETGPSYHSFLLRMWVTRSYTDTFWHISLESPHTGQKYVFHSLADMMSFLRKRMDCDDDKRSLPDGHDDDHLPDM